MATFTLTGVGIQALSTPGSLIIEATGIPATAGFGDANPANYYGIGRIRFGTADGWFPPIPIDAEFQIAGCPNGTTRVGYSLITGVTIEVAESAEQPYAGPTGPPGAGGLSSVGVRVTNNADQNATNGSPLTVAFNTELYDTDSIHSTSTNTSRLTCNTAGIYLIVAHGAFATNATGIREFWVSRLRSGVDIRIADINQAAVNLEPTFLSVTTLYELQVADYLELRAYQQSGSTLALKYYEGRSPVFGMQRVA